MLLANQAVAKFLQAEGSPAVFRVHDQPNYGKLMDYVQLLHTYQLMKTEQSDDLEDPTFINKSLQAIDNKHTRKALAFQALRSMAQAHYSINNHGHYGLGFSDYVHFTSPIRRYADLIIHRQLKNVWLKQKQPTTPKAYQGLSHVCLHISEQERVAQNVEREVKKLKSIRYMQTYVGKKMPGFISGMHAQAIFVELDSGIEGTIDLQRLPANKKVNFDKNHMCMTLYSPHRQLRLGDRVNVKILHTDLKQRKLLFELF